MEAWWVLACERVSFNKTHYPLDSIIVDTGTSVIVGSPSIVAHITAGIPETPNCADIDTYPDLYFSFGEDEYALAPSDYIIKITSGGETECFLGIQEAELPSQLGESFILGDTFIHKYYSHFDMGNKRVGFALAKDPSEIKLDRK